MFPFRGIDASPIVPGLYQGGMPEMGSALREAGFSAVVLCAEEYQPPAILPPHLHAHLAPVLAALKGIPYPNVEVIYAPNDDGDYRPTRDQLGTALRASRLAADRVRAGKKVLVTCMQGRNRSGLVTALTLHHLLGISGNQAVEMVRRLRAPIPALTNPHFVSVLGNIEAVKPKELGVLTEE